MIVASVSELRQVGKTLRSIVEQKFPPRNSIASFYFLRFICPAIVSPVHYKVLSGMTDSRILPFGLLFSLARSVQGVQ